MRLSSEAKKFIQTKKNNQPNDEKSRRFIKSGAREGAEEDFNDILKKVSKPLSS